MPYVLFQVKENLYALSSRYVREIVILPLVTPVPNMPPEHRGVINLRGKVLGLTDLRVKFGLPSAGAETEALVQLLHDREKDHLNWLDELEACLREHRPFKLARDPHGCKFGQWYDHFQTDNRLLSMELRKMADPHRIIHESANEILQKAERGDPQGAQALLNQRRKQEMALLTQLFEQCRRLLREHHRELALVLDCGRKRQAISIDAVESVERIPEDHIEPTSLAASLGTQGIACQVAKRAKTNQTLLVLDEAVLFPPGD